MSPTGLNAAPTEMINAARSSILALDSARGTVIQELSQGSVPEAEMGDSKDFIVYLNTRIQIYCNELYELGAIEVAKALPCPSPGQQGEAVDVSSRRVTPSSESIDIDTAGTHQTQTRAEQTETIEDAFRNALGEFDEMLAQEDARIASRIPSKREQGNSGDAVGSGDEITAARGQETSGGNDESSSGASTTTEPGGSRGPDDLGRGSGPTTGQESAGAGAPEGTLPPPEDDDIVARQLREAAEKETDPELKEKLWEEYWKYKGVRK